MGRYRKLAIVLGNLHQTSRILHHMAMVQHASTVGIPIIPIKRYILWVVLVVVASALDYWPPLPFGLGTTLGRFLALGPMTVFAVSALVTVYIYPKLTYSSFGFFYILIVAAALPSYIAIMVDRSVSSPYYGYGNTVLILTTVSKPANAVLLGFLFGVYLRSRTTLTELSLSASSPVSQRDVPTTNPDEVETTSPTTGEGRATEEGTASPSNSPQPRTLTFTQQLLLAAITPIGALLGIILTLIYAK